MYFGIGVVWHEVCESVDEVDEAVVEDEVVEVLDDELSSAQESSRLFMIGWVSEGRSQKQEEPKLKMQFARQSSKRNSKIEGLPAGGRTRRRRSDGGGEGAVKRPFHGGSLKDGPSGGPHATGADRYFILT